jgi:hypothetical protein
MKYNKVNGCRWHERKRGRVHAAFWWGDRKEREDMEYSGIDEKIILK